MAVLTEHIATTLGIDEAFAFVADFANSEQWDPGVASSVRVNPGPVGVGARYRLGIRMNGRVTPMEYAVTQFDAPRRVVLTGTGSGVYAIDDIAFESTADGTAITYIADIRLRGVLRLLAPLAGGSLRKIAQNAKAGMERTLAARAAAARTAAPIA